MIILIPAYEPDTQLLDVIDAIPAADPALSLVIVDDGSGPAYAQIFDGARRAGAHVISHPANQLVGRRGGYPLDFDRIYEVAVETGTALEIDGAPSHLDLDGEHARAAVAAGPRFLNC